MDRNLAWHCMSEDVSVALRKESVDRNNLHCVEEVSGDTSLSARRAWIEISTTRTGTPIGCVALRKESVDRNRLGKSVLITSQVALRKESVDRNY